MIAMRVQSCKHFLLVGGDDQDRRRRRPRVRAAARGCRTSPPTSTPRVGSSSSSARGPGHGAREHDFLLVAARQSARPSAAARRLQAHLALHRLGALAFGAAIENDPQRSNGRRCGKRTLATDVLRRAADPRRAAPSAQKRCLAPRRPAGLRASQGTPLEKTSPGLRRAKSASRQAGPARSRRGRQNRESRPCGSSNETSRSASVGQAPDGEHDASAWVAAGAGGHSAALRPVISSISCGLVVSRVMSVARVSPSRSTVMLSAIAKHLVETMRDIDHAAAAAPAAPRRCGRGARIPARSARRSARPGRICAPGSWRLRPALRGRRRRS